MRKSVILAVVSVGLFSFALAGQETYFDDSYARLSYVSGDTYVQRAQDLGQEAGTVNLAVISGDRLVTRDGRLEIHLGRQNYLRMDRHSRIEVIQLPERGRNLIKLAFESGEVYLRVTFLSQDQEIEVHTPDASFYVLEEGLYRLSTDESRETELRVLEGSMEAAGEEASEVIRTEERLVASDGRFIFGPTRLYSRTDDDFSDWNRMRESFLTRAVSNSYLPSELSSYEAELDYYGHWTYENPYGYVWVPHVVHDTWRPYYHGRWVWYPIIGYTWVSYDPWGWCVSHYGRWHWRFGLGWYWIPRLGWGPAWVHWYHGSHHYGWCPLSYHGYPGVIINNRYYGDGYYRDYPLTSRALVMVHKRQLQAPNISRVALNRNQVQGVDRVRLSSRQPAERPANGGSRLDGTARITPKTPIRNYTRSSASDRSSSSTARVRSSGADSGRQGRSDSTTIRSGNARPSIRSYPSQRSGAATRSLRTPDSTSARSRSAAATDDRSVRSRTSSSQGSMRTYSSRVSSRRASPDTGQAGRSISGSSRARSATGSSRSRTVSGSSQVRTYPSSSRSRSVTESRQVRSSPSSSRSRTVRSSSRSTNAYSGSAPRGSSSSARSTTRSSRAYPSASGSSARTQSRVRTAPSASSSRSSAVIRSSPPSRSRSSSSSVRSSRPSTSRSSASRSSSVRSSASRSSSSRSSVSRSSAPSRSSSGRSTAGRSSSSARSSGSRVRKK